MKTSIHLAFGALSFALLSFSLPGDHVRFAVKEKSKVAKVFEDKSNFHSTATHMTVDGEDVGEEGGDVKVSFEEQSRVEITDEYVSVKDGKPAKLKRTFEKLEGKSSQHYELPEGAESDEGDTDSTKEKTSALQGKTVVFTLDEKGEEYKPSFEDDKGDADLLKKLEEDMDLRGFLPSGAVAEGKSWEIEGMVFHSVLGNPGGDLKLKAEGDDEDADEAEMDEQFKENLKGKGEGTYKGEREVDGHRCAVIELKAELKTKGKQEKKEEGGHNGQMSIELEYTVEGELLWDLEGGHFRSCTLASKMKMAMKNVLSMEFNDEKHEMQQTTEFEGDGEFKASLGG